MISICANCEKFIRNTYVDVDKSDWVDTDGHLKCRWKWAAIAERNGHPSVKTKWKSHQPTEDYHQVVVEELRKIEVELR